MSTLKSDAITAATGTNTDMDLSGKGTGVPDIATGFKVGGTAGVPVNNLRIGTDGELITWDASGDPATVAVGTATHVLTSNGAGAAPTFQAAAAGGAWNFISTATASDDATITCTGIDTTYRTYVISLTNVLMSTGSNQVRMRIGDSGGIKTDSNYQCHVGKVYSYATGYDGAIVNAGDHFLIADYSGSDAIETGGATIFIHRTGATVALNGTVGMGHSNGYVQGGWFIGTYPSTSFALTQVQLLTNTTNLTSGTMDLWGISHA